MPIEDHALLFAQRAMVAANLVKLQGSKKDIPQVQDGEEVEGCASNDAPDNGTSARAAAKALNVGSKSVDRAVIVRHSGIPALQQAVEQGVVSLAQT